MFSQERIQQATKEIILILEDCCLSDRTRRWYTHHYAELDSYIRDNEISEISETTFLDFLHVQYGISIPSVYTKGIGSTIGAHIKPLAILDCYLLTEKVDPKARMRNSPFICPEGFCDSYGAFMEYLQQKELSSSTIRNYRETTQQFIRHMVSIRIESSEMISSAGILSFLSAFKHFSTNSFSYLLTGIRQYLSFLFRNGF